MLQKFFKYIFQSMAGMLGISVYILADTYLSRSTPVQMVWRF